jgi:3-oxoacyl-[acyl-carrier protein] reductase
VGRVFFQELGKPRRAVLSLIRAAGGDALAMVANVSSSEDRRRMIQAAMDWAGRIDILVNKAGANLYDWLLGDLPESAWDKTFEVKVKAAFVLSKLIFHAWMREHGGVILNMASVAVLTTSSGALADNVSIRKI